MRACPVRWRFGGWILALVLSVAVSCAPPARDDTVVYASGADLESADPIVTIHPLARQVQRHALLVTLVRLDSALRPVPYYARRWSWSDDRRTLTLELDPSLRWHDGRPTTSADVAFTLERVRDPAAGSPRASELAQLAGWEEAGPHGMVLLFSAAQSALPGWLAELPIAPAHLLRGVAPDDHRRAGYGQAPVGNGPFRFVSRDRGERWVFARNEAFPPAMGGPPRLPRLVVAVVDEATTKFAGLVSGDLHVAGIAPTMAGLVRQDPRLELVTYPVLFTTALVFNPSRPPFDDVRVRRAFDLAVDRARIAETAFAGLALPAAGPVPPDNALALPLEPRHDPSAAAALLDAAGWALAPGERWRRRGDSPLRVELLTVGSADNAVEQLIQDDLARVGVRVEIRQMEMASFLSIARAPEKRFDLLITGIPGDLSLAHLAAMFDSRLAGGALDYARWHEPELDAALHDASRAESLEAAEEAWASVQRILARDVPVAWLLHSRGVQGVSARLEGVTMDLRGELATISDWWLAPTRAPVQTQP